MSLDKTDAAVAVNGNQSKWHGGIFTSRPARCNSTMMGDGHAIMLCTISGVWTHAPGEKSWILCKCVLFSTRSPLVDSSMGGPWTTLDGVLAVVIYYTIRGFLACPSTSRRLVIRSPWGVSPVMFFASVHVDGGMCARKYR